MDPSHFLGTTYQGRTELSSQIDLCFRNVPLSSSLCMQQNSPTPTSTQTFAVTPRAGRSQSNPGLCRPTDAQHWIQTPQSHHRGHSPGLSLAPSHLVTQHRQHLPVCPQKPLRSKKVSEVPVLFSLLSQASSATLCLAASQPASWGYCSIAQFSQVQ